MALPYLIYIRSCPVCGDGLCRVRVCAIDQQLHGCILCDECDTVWTDPALSERIDPPNEYSSPVCPDCGETLWNDTCHWADIQEVCLLGWYDKVKVART